LSLIKKSIYKIAKLKWYITKPITIGVRILLIKDNKVLLVKHTYQSHWYLPGGGVEKGETLEQAIKRECKEELGAKLNDINIFGAYSNFFEYKNDHIVMFICSNFTLEETINSEIETLNFFDMDNLPKGISPGSRKRVLEYINKDYPKHDVW
jgi:ADP-ribose pyrophosphatase YjhB (NUDIX family)